MTHKLPTVIVVGAAGGIGKQVVLQLQSRARILAVVQNDEQRLSLGSLVEAAIECDLADSNSVEAVLKRLDAICGDGLDALIFTAAMQPVGPLELVLRPELERLFAINVFGTFQFVQGLIPALRNKRGRVVLFSSMAGRVAAPVLGAYNGSKFALEGLADTLRRELRLSDVSLSLVEPGGVLTPMAAAQGAQVQQFLDKLDADAARRYGPLLRGYRAMTDAGLKHASTPEQVAKVAVDAAVGSATPRARYVAGMDAKLVILLSRLLPVRWLDGLLLKLTLGK